MLSMTDELTDEQREYWNQVGWSRETVKPSGDQTAEQALNFTVAAIRYAYTLEGLPVPPADAVARELRAPLP